MIDNSIFKVGLYIRLSREDGDKQESESISNQRKILERYIMENNLEFVKEYVDDGVSGTVFDRPGFSKMIQDIEKRKINMVITKDLSRLGRDYIIVGEYIEKYFPKNNIRYVAINDGIDTFIDSTNNDITPFKAIMNDMYAKDISKKIKSVIKEKQKNGEYMCSIVAYGYKKHPSIKNRLIIDNKVKNIVEIIFNMYSNGYGSGEIVKFLNLNQYLSPSGYRKTGIVQDKNKTGYNWNEVTLCNMLKNEVYIGNTVQNKNAIISYKIKKVRAIERKEQIRVNDTHKPIIDKDLFEKVQCILNKRGNNTKLKYDYLLRGMLYCHHCKRKLQIVKKKNSKKNSKLYSYIVCSDYKKRMCYPLSINYDKFEKYIISIIKDICKTYADKESFYLIYEKYKKKVITDEETKKEENEKIEKSLFEINNNLDKMYIDKLKGILQEEDYVRVYEKFNLEKINLIKRKKELEKVLIKQKQIYIENEEKNKAEQIIKEFLKFNNIDKMLLYRLINKIEIDKDRNVYIFFNFSKMNFNINENFIEAYK